MKPKIGRLTRKHYVLHAASDDEFLRLAAKDTALWNRGPRSVIYWLYSMGLPAENRSYMLVQSFN